MHQPVEAIAEIELKLRSAQSDKATTETLVRFAEPQLMDFAAAWQRARDEQRQTIQALLFSKGLVYSPISKSLNPSSTSLCKMLEQMNPKNLRLASPTGFEPVLPP